MDPRSFDYQLWELVVLFCVVYAFWVVPFQIAFVDDARTRAVKQKRRGALQALCAQRGAGLCCRSLVTFESGRTA